MPKKKVKRTTSSHPMQSMMTNKQFTQISGMVHNEITTLHRDVLNRLLNPQDNIDSACGYLSSLDTSHYRDMYDRMGLAKRVVQIWPDECWQAYPSISENEAPEETDFEKKWKELQLKLSLYSYLHRIDVLSGIGNYGIMLLGDGGKLDKPLPGIDTFTGLPDSKKAKERNLLYVRVFDQSVLGIESYEEDVSSPRYGHPKVYNVQFTKAGNVDALEKMKVHWTRVLHVADNRESNEIQGVPRMQCVYNNLYDVKKVGGGSGEMFWKGGFPGYAFEMNPEALAAGAEMDAESVKEQMVLWASGLQRWLALTGVTAKSLAPQVADPTGHVDVHFKLIAVAMGVPYRVLLGSEEAKLASVQDKRTWNGRVARRQTGYVTPMIVRPFIDRLIATGILPEPKQYTVVWPDLNVATEDEIAKVAAARTEAFAKYFAARVDNLIPPRQYLTQIHKFTDEQAEAILKEMDKYENELNPQPQPAPIAQPGVPAVKKVIKKKKKKKATVK